MGGVDAEGDGETLAEGDGEEVVAVAFGSAKFDVGDDAAADGAHDERAEEFGEVGADGVHGCPSGSELRVVNRDSVGCAVPSVRGCGFVWGYAARVACLNLWHLWNPECPRRAILLCVISPLRHKRFSGFRFKNKCGE